MGPRFVRVGGYIDTDPYYVSPEEEAAMYGGPPDWDEGAIPETGDDNDGGALVSVMLAALEAAAYYFASMDADHPEKQILEAIAAARAAGISSPSER